MSEKLDSATKSWLYIGSRKMLNIRSLEFCENEDFHVRCNAKRIQKDERSLVADSWCRRAGVGDSRYRS